MKAARVAPSPADFDLPPRLLNSEGRPRTVGVEVEFTGLSAAMAAGVLAREFGGEVIEDDPHAFTVKGSGIGDVRVTLDVRHLHPGRGDGTLLGSVVPTLASWIGTAASLVAPCEFVTAPIPFERLHEIDQAVAALRAAGAKGTQDGLLYAFGLHFNPEAPRLDAEGVASILKAFVLLDPWLRRAVSPDRTRSLLGFADPFPDAYIRRIVAPDYQPDLPELIDDYMADNPTRNRDLDLLPLLLHLDASRVRAALPNEKINARPTFHYRLPDARVSDPGWSIAPDWNRWVAVERVAADPERLERLGRAYLAFPGEAKSWADASERIAFA